MLSNSSPTFHGISYCSSSACQRCLFRIASCISPRFAHRRCSQVTAAFHLAPPPLRLRSHPLSYLLQSCCSQVTAAFHLAPPPLRLRSHPLSYPLQSRCSQVTAAFHLAPPPLRSHPLSYPLPFHLAPPPHPNGCGALLSLQPRPRLFCCDSCTSHRKNLRFLSQKNK